MPCSALPRTPLVSIVDDDPSVRRALERLNGPRYVFTNGSTRHGERVLEQLGVDDLFDGLFAVEHARLVPKPSELLTTTL